MKHLYGFPWFLDGEFGIDLTWVNTVFPLVRQDSLSIPSTPINMITLSLIRFTELLN